MDFKKLRKLIALVQESGIAELEITEGEEKVRIVRDFPPTNVHHVAPSLSVPPVNLPVSTDTATEVLTEAADAEVFAGHTICSPMVGTFYRSPSPSAQSFVEIGQRVEAGEALCIIEAMKLLNEIECDHAGVIKDILVDNGQPVEYGQPLFLIQP